MFRSILWLLIICLCASPSQLQQWCLAAYKGCLVFRGECINYLHCFSVEQRYEIQICILCFIRMISAQQGLTHWGWDKIHYTDVIMGPIASQITSLTSVYSTVYSDADQRKYQSSASLAFVRVIHRGPVNSPHKWPVTRKMFPFDDVIMLPPFRRRRFQMHYLE